MIDEKSFRKNSGFHKVGGLLYFKGFSDFTNDVGMDLIVEEVF